MKLVIAGGIVGFISSLGIILIQYLMNRKIGKLTIYKKIISMDGYGGFGAFRDNEKINFLIPIKMQLVNTTNMSRIIRDVNIVLYNHKDEVGKMKQIEGTGNKQNFGEGKGSYSFIVPAQSIKEIKFLYAFKIVDSQKNACNFNNAKIIYYDEKEEKVEYSIIDLINEPWSEQLFPPEDEWIKLQ